MGKARPQWTIDEPPPIPCTDCHNHLHLLPVDGREMARLAAAGVRRSVVNATREEEWPAVLKLAADFPRQVIPALGVHPWHVAAAAPGWERRLEAALAAHPEATVGECGLDGAVAVDREIQLAAFRSQLRLAREHRRLLSIHLVRAWGDFSLLLRAEPPPPLFLMHGYCGSLETARQLAKNGAWFSAGPRLLGDRFAKQRAVFRQLPPDRIVLESDAPAGPLPPRSARPPAAAPDHPARLPLIARELARELGCEADAFLRQTEANAAILLA